jgi:hypothetical protein
MRRIYAHKGDSLQGKTNGGTVSIHNPLLFKSVTYNGDVLGPGLKPRIEQCQTEQNVVIRIQRPLFKNDVRFHDGRWQQGEVGVLDGNIGIRLGF